MIQIFTATVVWTGAGGPILHRKILQKRRNNMRHHLSHAQEVKGGHDSHKGPAQAHFGHLHEHLKHEHEMHKHHRDHASKMHHMGEHKE